MGFGIYMSASGEHMMAPMHAHLNLLGWVTIALYGTFYTLVPQAAAGRLAQLQILCAQVGVVVITPGIAMAIMGTGEGLAKAGSILVLFGMLLFLVVVVRAEAGKAQGAAR